MVPEVALYDYLYVAVVGGRSDAVMDSRQPETHVVDGEEPEAGVLAVDNLDSGPFLLLASPVNYKEITFPEDELIECHKGSLIVGLRFFGASACTTAKAHLVMEAGAVSLVHAAQLLTKRVITDDLFHFAPHPLTRSKDGERDLIIADTSVQEPDVPLFIRVAVDAPAKSRSPLRPVEPWLNAFYLG